MNLTKKYITITIVYMVIMLIFQACNSGNNKQQTTNDEQQTTNKTDTIIVEKTDTVITGITDISDTIVENNNVKSDVSQSKAEQPVVLIYNFHVTNRCPSCIAIEEATTKTLNTYFLAEVKKGRIKRQILNVDDEVNATISEKYQAFGSGLFVTRVFKGKETTTDMTGDGFKFAKNKEEKFIEILKTTVSKYLK